MERALERRLDKLDDAFLFGLASTAIIISFMEIPINTADLARIIGILPILALGTFLPLYVGYFRGAIELNNPVERMRGWIYFIIGTSSYIALFVTNELK